MFEIYNRLTGKIVAEQENTSIRLSGFRVDSFMKDIHKQWNTSKINSYMFTKSNSFYCEFRNFFAPDVLFMINELLKKKGTQLGYRTYSKLREVLIENTWLKRLDEEQSFQQLDLSRLKDLTYQPIDFQLEFLKEYSTNLPKLNLKGYLLAAAPGSGKTFTSLAAMHCANVDYVFVICPGNAVSNVWQDNIEKVFKEKQTYWLSTSNQYYNGEKFIVAHYEYLEKVDAILKMIQRKNKDASIGIILDESHNLNEVKSLRTIRFMKLCKDSQTENIIFASGTPIKALGKETIPLFSCIDPYFDSFTEERFKSIYGSNPSRGVEILKHRLGMVSFKVTKDQIRDVKPVLENIEVTSPNGNLYTLTEVRKVAEEFIKQRVAYYKSRQDGDEREFLDYLERYKNSLRSLSDRKEFETYEATLKRVKTAQGNIYLVKDESLFCNRYENTKILPTLRGEDKTRFSELKTIYKYVSLKIQGECLGQVILRKRIECILDLCQYLDYSKYIESTTKKTVIFTSYQEVLEKALMKIKELGYQPLAVYAKTNKNLTPIIDIFDKDEDANPLIATYKSLSTAVPLIMADCMILIDAPFRAYILEQAISRIDRLGADTVPHVYTAILKTGEEPNMSSRNVDILKWSMQQVEDIMGIKSPFEIEQELNPVIESFDTTVKSPIADITVFEYSVPLKSFQIEW